MSTTLLEADTRLWTAAELRFLSREERDEILTQAAILAQDDYLGDTDLTAFGAFEKEDLHGSSSNTESR